RGERRAAARARGAARGGGGDHRRNQRGGDFGLAVERRGAGLQGRAVRARVAAGRPQVVIPTLYVTRAGTFWRGCSQDALARRSSPAKSMAASARASLPAARSGWACASISARSRLRWAT